MNGNSSADKFAITLSSLCVLHCFFTPLLLLAVPSLAAFGLDNELFHVWMVVAVIPTSLFALFVGCKQHKQYNFFSLGILGLLILVLALFSEALQLGEFGEKGLTLVGSSVMILAHYFNYARCKKVKAQQDGCGC